MASCNLARYKSLLKLPMVARHQARVGPGRGLVAGRFRQGSDQASLGGRAVAGLGELGAARYPRCCESYGARRAGGVKPDLKSCCTAARTRIGLSLGGHAGPHRELVLMEVNIYGH